MNILSSLLSFLREVKAEIRKITWPSRDDLIGTVTIVCMFTIAAAIVLSAMDAAFGTLIKRLIS
jgi:preprotein translocase subunit SecE